MMKPKLSYSGGIMRTQGSVGKEKTVILGKQKAAGRGRPNKGEAMG